MNILNFAHPLTDGQRTQIEEAIGRPIQQVLEVRVQFELDNPFTPQVVAMLDTLNIASERWQSEGWLIILPSMNYIAAILLAELHGRMGHFPTTVRLRPIQGMLVTEYEFAEIINLEQIRQSARTRR